MESPADDDDDDDDDEDYKLGGPPHTVIVTIRDNKDYIRVLSYSYYTTITGWGVLLTYKEQLWQIRGPPPFLDTFRLP